MNRVWTEEEIDILRRDREAKVPVPVTAAKLGRPVPATYARARLIGTLVQPHQSWDETSETRLRELVSADPPMTDKRIAAELGRTVTQIRWKMQDLGLIGVRDLSKLAKVTASGANRPKHNVKPAVRKPPRQQSAPARVTVPSQASALEKTDPRAALNQALKSLEKQLVEQLKVLVATSEAGMIQAAMDAISEKSRIDRHLAELGKKEAQQRPEAIKAKAETKCKSPDIKRQVPDAKPLLKKPQPAVKKPTLPAVQGISLAVPLRPGSQPEAPPTPKIIVTEAPAPARLETPTDSTAGQVSGRGGWKSVRRDPARAMAQAKAKAKPTSRADAVDLAQAAQIAIERFIAERGVTRTETSGIPALVSRLQARGYIVVRDEAGWVIDQRHRVDSEAALVAFAQARGITLDIAA
jgi:predicted ArsR family transcriptional regulator